MKKQLKSYVNQQEFAAMIGCDQSTLSIWRRSGKHDIPEPVTGTGKGRPLLFNKAEAEDFAEDLRLKRLGVNQADLSTTYIRMTKLCEQLDVHRNTLVRWERQSGFPPPIRVGGNRHLGKVGSKPIGTTTIYSLVAVEKWLSEQDARN